MTSLTKNPHPPTKKFFFECRPEDLPRLLRVWTAPYCFQYQSYVFARPRAIQLFWHGPLDLDRTCQHFGCWSANILYLEIGEKPGIFWLTSQPHSSSADCARELYKPSKDLACLRVCNEKIISGFGFQVFCEWHHK